MSRLDASELESLRELHERVAVREAELAFARADLQLTATKLFYAHSETPQTHSVCLQCGMFNPKNLVCKCLATG